MAVEENPKIPTPQQAEQQRQKTQNQNIGFDDILRYVALGIAPTAPRLPEAGMKYSTLFGGYPKGYASGESMKGVLTFNTLRSVSRRSSLLSAIISRRLHQTSRYTRVARSTKKGEVGFRVVHKREGDEDFEVPEGFSALCREAEQMILRPWRVFVGQDSVFKDVEPTFAGAMSKLTEDLLIINRPVIELGRDPLGVPRAFGVIDGANIIPTFQAMKFLTAKNRDMPKDWNANYYNYSSALRQVADKYKLDIDENTEYMYILGGRPVAAFRYGDLIFGPQFPISDINFAGYPPSLTERAIFTILAEIMAMKANSQYFEVGSMMETIVAMKGSNQDAHIQEFQNILRGNMSGIPGMFRVPFVATPGGKDDLSVIPIKQNHRDMLFDVYIQKLTNLACAIYSMHPSEINEAPRAGDGGGGISQPSQTKQINMAQEEGLESLLEHFKTSFFDPILEQIDPDMCFEWEYGKDESQQLDLITKRGAFTTVDERRKMDGLKPIGPEKGGDVLDNPFVHAKDQREADQQRQEAEAKMQAQQGGPPGAPGGPGNEGPPGAGGKGKGKKAPPKEEQQPDYENESATDRISRVAQRLQGKA